MPPVGFEPTISVSERPQTYALDRAATGTGIIREIKCLNVAKRIDLKRAILGHWYKIHETYTLLTLKTPN